MEDRTLSSQYWNFSVSACCLLMEIWQFSYQIFNFNIINLLLCGLGIYCTLIVSTYTHFFHRISCSNVYKVR